MARTAVITGAGDGIGRAVTIELAHRGFRLALAGRRLEKLAEKAALCNGDVWFKLVDVGNADDVAEFFADVVARWPRLDLLFNNAGNNIGARPLAE